MFNLINSWAVGKRLWINRHIIHYTKIKVMQAEYVSVLIWKERLGVLLVV